MVFSVVMPVVLLILFGSVIGGDTQTTKVAGFTIAIDAYFSAGIAAYSIMLIGFSSLMISIVTARESGRLKRYRGTPMPSWVFLTAQILQTMVTILLLVGLLLAIAVAVYGIELDAAGLLAFALYMLVGAATMCALGLAVSRFATTVDTASAIGPFGTVILALRVRGVHPGEGAPRLAGRRRPGVPARASRRGTAARPVAGGVRERDRRHEPRRARTLGPRGAGRRRPQLPLGTARRRDVAPRAFVSRGSS